jgi:uncharacterized protein YjlB
VLWYIPHIPHITLISHLTILGIFQGSSKLLLGVGESDESDGLELSVQAGDVIVLPAGTAHSCAVSSADYKYIGVYPQVGFFSKRALLCL